MAKSNKPTHVAKPVYPGGTKAMRAFVTEHLQYPEEAKTAKVEGTVVVRYSLDYRGKVVETKVKKGIGHGCDEEAQRVVKLLRFQVPQARKRKVRIHQDVNIHFRLPKEKKPPAKPQSGQLQITYTTSSQTAGSSESVTKQPSQPSHGYTIKW